MTTHGERLARIEEGQNALKTAVGALATSMTSFQEEMRRTLRGQNGDVGLVAEVKALTKTVNGDPDAKIPGLASRLRGLEYLAVGLIGAGGIAGAAATDVGRSFLAYLFRG